MVPDTIAQNIRNMSMRAKEGNIQIMPKEVYNGGPSTPGIPKEVKFAMVVNLHKDLPLNREPYSIQLLQQNRSISHQ